MLQLHTDEVWIDHLGTLYLGRKPLGHLGMSRGDGRFT
jgi:hypothetical protein